MIDFNYVIDFALSNHQAYLVWLDKLVTSEGGFVGQVDYIFCDDSYLLAINKKYLDHDTYTDIITFDYTEGKTIAGDIYISVDRVKENASLFDVSFDVELRRVMSHGLLHLFGYKDKTDHDIKIMRAKENEKIQLFHVEQ